MAQRAERRGYNTEDVFCDECGCDIRCADDIGFQETVVKFIPGPFVGFQEAGEREVTICKSCTEDEERRREEFRETDEYKFELEHGIQLEDMI